jgi:hypothetical protein
MIKKLQNISTLSIYIILLLLTSPGFYLIEKEQKDDRLSIIILVISQLLIVLSISIAIKNIIISFLIEAFSNASNSLPYEINYRISFSKRTYQALRRSLVIIIIMSGYCMVCFFMSLQYMVGYSSMFIIIYSLSINIVPNKIVFFNNECIIHSKTKNILLYIKAYSIEDRVCNLILSDNSKYDVNIEKADIENLLIWFEMADISLIS